MAQDKERPRRGYSGPRPGDKKGGQYQNGPKGGEQDKPTPEEKKAEKELQKWLDRMEQRAMAGGLLSGPGGTGTGSAELVNLLRSNPELAVRVQAWIAAQKALPGPMPGIAGAGGLQTQLFTEFPELYQQYVAATGKSIVYDAAGNPVRLVDPNKYFGMREGDTLTTPTLYGAKGEELPLPEIQYPTKGKPIGAGANDQALHFGAIPVEEQMGLGRERASAFYGDVFDIEDLAGGEQ